MAKKTVAFGWLQVQILECWASDWTPQETMLELGLKKTHYDTLASEILKKLPFITTHNRQFFSKSIILENRDLITGIESYKPIMSLRVG